MGETREGRPFGSLTETIRRAEAEVASWSPAKREWARRATTPRPVEDPCQSPRRCDEAQTCVGGCTLYNRRGTR